MSRVRPVSFHHTLGGVRGLESLILLNLTRVIWFDLVAVLCQSGLVDRVAAHRVDLLQALIQRINLAPLWLLVHCLFDPVLRPGFVASVLDFLRDGFVLIHAIVATLGSVLDKARSSDGPVG